LRRLIRRPQDNIPHVRSSLHILHHDLHIPHHARPFRSAHGATGLGNINIFAVTDNATREAKHVWSDGARFPGHPGDAEDEENAAADEEDGEPGGVVGPDGGSASEIICIITGCVRD